MKRMSHGLIISEIDPAGTTMLRELVETVGNFNKLDDKTYQGHGTYLFLGKEDTIYLKKIDAFATKFNLDYVIVLSRHKAASGEPSLTVHPTGNFFAKADYGGNPRELQNTMALPMQSIFLEILNCPLAEYRISLECTHHGPTGFETPFFFVELGSSEKQWKDRKAALFLVKSVLKAKVPKKKKSDVVIGFGGNHYVAKFSEMEKETFSFGHMCPKYAVDELNEDLIKQMLEKTTDRADYAILDNKGLKGRQKTKIKGILDSLGTEYI
jgi:D-aminoacyl-tRNA deacylase